MTMVIMAIFIFIICAISGIWNIYYFFLNGHDLKRWYIIGKGFVVLYLGVLYGLIAIDHWYDIIDFPVVITNKTSQLVRVAAFITSFIFLMDSWIRNKL